MKYIDLYDLRFFSLPHSPEHMVIRIFWLTKRTGFPSSSSEVLLIKAHYTPSNQSYQKGRLDHPNYQTAPGDAVSTVNFLVF